MVSGHVWANAIEYLSPSLDYAGFYARMAAPMLVLAALVAVGWLRVRPALALTPLVVALTVLAMARLDASGQGNGQLLAFPWVIGICVLGFAAADSRTRAGADRGRLYSALTLAAVGCALVVVARVSGLRDVGAAQTFTVVFVSIVVEALPFVLLGAVVSAAIEVFVPERAFTRIAALPLRLQVPGVALAGMTMPVCECGSVPVARRLISKGVHPSAGIAFMLASPVINPVVLLSTAVAFQGRGALEMVAGRAAIGLGVAVIAGAVIGRDTGFKLVSRPPGHGHEHTGGRVRTVLDHTSGELLFMGRFVVLGAAIAALMQTTISQSVFTGVLAAPLVGAVVLMALAFVLSLCSEADAFVALSFTGFSMGPLLAFLTFGPVLDVKLVLLYAASFGRRFVLRLFLVAAPVILAGSLVWEEMFR